MAPVLSRVPRNLLLRFLSSQVTTQQKNLNTRPIIGVVGLDTDSEHGKTYIPATYINFLLQGGARVVPIRGSQPKDYYDEIVGLTNGALIPGGTSRLKDSHFSQTARDVFDAALKINQSGEYYPLWGTCLGFQMMCVCVVGEDIRSTTDSYDICLPLEITPEAAKSRLLGNAPQEVIDILKTEPITQHQHKYGLLTETIKNSVLGSFFNVVTTNKDRAGVEFASSIEAKEYPFYATQWHPEKNNFNWHPKFQIDHGFNGVKVVQYFGNFFVQEARKSRNSYPDIMAEAKNLIQNCKRIYFDDATFQDYYYID